MECIKCGKVLTNLDISIHKKMINRGATTFQCIDCLCEYMSINREDILEKARYFQKQGCLLFEGMNLK